MAALLAGRKRAPASLGDVLVLGLGKSGTATVNYCLNLLDDRVSSLTVYGGKSSQGAQAFAAQAEAAGARVVFDDEQVRGRYDLCVKSPGISEFGAFAVSAAAASSEMISEVEFAWRESAADSTWIAVTGTNGKTTTTACAAHLARAAGWQAAAVGNIGDTCIEAVAAGQTRVYVAEVSSYQLANTVSFAPDAAVLLNITPDHLAWHRTHGNYVAAKFRLLRNLGTGATAVLDAENPTVRAEYLRLAGDEERAFDLVPVGAADGLGREPGAACAAYLREDGMLVVERDGAAVELVRADELLIPGRHNAANALFASAAVLAAGADAASVRAGLRSFASLPHRIEACGDVRGVACYNDSKATNVDATLAALAAFDPRRPIVLLGGDDKGTDLAPLVEAAVAHCKAVVLYGASRARFEAAFAEADLPVLRADHMEDAFETALGAAVPGDIVLLSPACASFDEFANYEQRGDVFKQLVKRAAAG